jgi:hypothetical protein
MTGWLARWLAGVERLCRWLWLVVIGAVHWRRGGMHLRLHGGGCKMGRSCHVGARGA